MALCLLAAPVAAAAGDWNNPMSAMLGGMLRSQLDQQIMNQGRTVHEVLVPSGPGPGGAAPGTPAPTVPRWRLPITASDFRPTGRRIMPRRLADEAPGATPAQKRELAALYEQMLAQYEQAGRPHNVAGALTYVLAAAALVAGGPEPDDALEEAVLRQLNDALGSAPAFARMPPAERQALYESAVIAAGYALNTYLQAQRDGDPAQAQLARSVAETSVLQAFGRPFRDFAFTPGGIVLR